MLKPHRLVFLACTLPVIVLASERDDTESPYDRHVIFDHAPAAPSYVQSAVLSAQPSTVDAIGGRLPVDTTHGRFPGAALRVSWISGTGGDWQASLKARSLYTLRNAFEGDAVSLWVYAEKGLSSDQSPWIHLEDEAGNETTTISLVGAHGSLPPGKWEHLVIPFASFKGLYRSTDVSRFDSRRLAGVVLEQGLDDGVPHTLYLADVQVVDSGASSHRRPEAPRNLSVKGAERHFDLHWEELPGASPMRYVVYRSIDGQEYRPIGLQDGRYHRFVDFYGDVGARASYQVRAEDTEGQLSDPSNVAEGQTHPMTDDELLSMVQEGCFRYYWENGHPHAGMALEVTPGNPNLVALGASGFGIMALVSGTERGFVTRAEAAQRMLKILHFLDKADRFHGVWPHFLDGRTGHVIPLFGPYDDGGDLVETAFLSQGLLTARGYFNRASPDENEIRSMITRLWEGVDWSWYRKDPKSDFLYWHWSPDHAWHISHPLVGWNETMVVYLLAIASPTHPVPASLYYSGWAGQSETAVRYRRAWSRTTAGDHYANGHDYYGIKLDVGEGTGGDLFFTQFSFLGFDPRGKRDRYTDYFANNRALALINRAYCVANPNRFAGYGPDCWGLSAGINAGGGMPEPSADNGTICTSAALGVFPYTPQESMAALKHFYRDLGPRIWGIYGFHDGFNQTQDWYEPSWMGLNQAQIVVMIENYRAATAWKAFMSNPEIGHALDAIGFTTDRATQP
jgi:exo beta-1,2-glucooligosaccharide sophorohydrolase (non-reducing end)